MLAEVELILVMFGKHLSQNSKLYVYHLNNREIGVALARDPRLAQSLE